MSTIHTLARTASDSFVSDTRESGETFRKLKDDAPEWITDAIHEAHGGMMPEDIRYRWIEEAFDAIADADEDDDLDDVGSEYAEDVDVYNMNLYRWLASHLSRAGYIEEAVDEYGAPEPFDLPSLLQRGQMMERREIFAAVREALEALAEADDDA
jgi:hypothetical protein